MFASLLRHSGFLPLCPWQIFSVVVSNRLVSTTSSAAGATAKLQSLFKLAVASDVMQLYAVVRSKGADSWIKVRSPLLVLNAITVHGSVEHTRLTKSTDVIKLGQNVLCPCSRELAILLCYRCYWCRVAPCTASLFSAFYLIP